MEITHGNSWEPIRCGPFVTFCKVGEHFNTVHVVLGTQELVHQKELTNNINDIYAFDQNVYTYQVYAFHFVDKPPTKVVR